MLSFITGSRAYGCPKASSDVDLVVLVSVNDFRILEALAESKTVGGSDAGPTTEDRLSGSFRFGRMNVLALTCPIAFGVWKIGTDQLIEETKAKKEPVTRERAVEVFDGLLVKHGLRKKTKEKPTFDIGHSVVAYKGTRKEFKGLITDYDEVEKVYHVSYRGQDKWASEDDLESIPMTEIYILKKDK